MSQNQDGITIRFQAITPAKSVSIELPPRIFTLVYALYAIPVFMWYIIMLGVLFRSIIARASSAVLGFYRYLELRNYHSDL